MAQHPRRTTEASSAPGTPRGPATGQRPPRRAGRPGSRRSGVPLKRRPERRPAQRHQPPAVGDKCREAGIRRPRSPGDPPDNFQKVRDIAGLYLQPPDGTLVLGVDAWKIENISFISAPALSWSAFMLRGDGRGPGTAISRRADTIRPTA
jgi:hypothetical protein